MTAIIWRASQMQGVGSTEKRSTLVAIIAGCRRFTFKEARVHWTQRRGLRGTGLGTARVRTRAKMFLAYLDAIEAHVAMLEQEAATFYH